MFAALVMYFTVAACVAAMLPLWFDESPELIEGLGPEGKVVALVGVGLLWPLLIVVGLAWLIRAAVRGIGQVARLARPTRTPLPKATARTKP